MGRQVFTAGEILTAANMNDLSDQTVMVFDDATARTTAIPTPVEGMVTYLKDEDEVTVFDGSAFKAVGPGRILQVVSTAKTDTFIATLTAGANVAVTGLSVSITPSASSSKMLITADINSGGAVPAAALARDGDLINIGDAAGSRRRIATLQGGGGAGVPSGLSMSFLDSPASTSSVTYQVHMVSAASGTTTSFVNRSTTDSDNADSVRASSTITVMEVAG